MVRFLQPWKIKMMALGIHVALYNTSSDFHYQLTDFVSVIYCCVTQYLKFSSLKQYLFVLLVSVGESFRHCLLGFSPESLTCCNKCQLDCGLVKVQLGKNFLPRSRIGWQDSASHGMLGKGPQSSLAVGQRPLSVSCQVGLFNVLNQSMPAKETLEGVIQPDCHHSLL